MTRNFHLVAAFLALVAGILLGAATPLRAQATRMVNNIATLQWGADAARKALASNRVDTRVTLTDVAVATPNTLGAGDLSVGLIQSSCRATPGGETLSGRSLTSTSTFTSGQPLVIAIEQPAANRDPDVIDTISLHVRSGRDEEQLLFVETAANSGRFAAIIRTQAGGTVAHSDCRLAVTAGQPAAIAIATIAGGAPIAGFTIRMLVDPFGVVFDSRDGAPVTGVRVTLIDVATGLPAQVFGDDGISSYPSSVLTGQLVTDGGGTVYTFGAGDYRFPLVRPGTYRLRVEPVAPYSFASAATASDLAALRRPDGAAFAILAASFGAPFTLSSPEAVRIDVPLDRPVTPIVVAKSASRQDAEAGDLVQYRVTIRNPDAAATGALVVADAIPAQMRLRPGTVRLDGQATADPIADGRTLTFALPALPAAATATLTYVLEVLPGAAAGDAVNRVSVSGPRGLVSNVADAVVRIQRETIADRMTIVGRVIDGACTLDPTNRPGIAGVRVMMEDGSYSVTDRDGRYHFEGVRTGTHVVQIDDQTLPADRVATDCADDLRSGGRATSRFVDGSGGMLKRVDFHAIPGARAGAIKPAAFDRPAFASDQDAAASGRDWLAGQEPGIGFLFPAIDHNPRAPAVRVAIKHFAGQKVRLSIDGRPVDAVTFEGTRKNADATVAVSLWRGVPIDRDRGMLTAEVIAADGKVVQTLDREIFFSNAAVRADLVRSKSRLVADGVTRPVIALRLTDAAGRPVHHGLAGDFALPAPYYPAIEADAQQARQLAGLERARPTWRVEGDDGIAFVELEPTTASGNVVLRFAFRDGQRSREQRLEAWIEPGQNPWTIVGLAEGSVGFNRLDRHLEALGPGADKLATDGRLALYAKGRIQGRWLLTAAYDSDRKERESRFAGTIDPTAYFTVYADRSEQRYDASSLRKLYLKLERPQFYALFGDYETGIDEPKLARYERALNGGKAEYRSERVSATAFAADAPTSHRRDEIQGNGLSGPYALASRRLLANSENIVIETRDRLRSNRIVDSRLLARHVDYDIDYRAGTLRFRSPVLSRSSSGDPVFIVADYEVDGVADRKLVAGGRVALRSADQKVQVAATAIHDRDGDRRTDLGGIDVRYRPTAATELRAEAAVSRTRDEAGTRTATAWQVEAEHHAGNIDLLVYAGQRGDGFGLGQTNAGENGTRKIGFDGRLKLGRNLEASLSAWNERHLDSGATRTAGRALVEYRGLTRSARAGLVLADDRLADGREARSTLVQLGASQKLFANRLELDAQTELPIFGEDESIDLPTRHRLTGRFAVSRDVALVASYEIAKGDAINARTARLGFDLSPWAGARFALAGNVQDIAEYGPRSYASFGLAQSVALNKHLTIDASIDGNRTIGGIDPANVIDPRHPVASGGFLGSNALTEDFLAVTAGATWRSRRWSITGRGEYRDGDAENRHGLTLGALRQIGEGRALGGSLNLFVARQDRGATTRTANAQLAYAHRPSTSAWSFLDKLELRADSVTNAVAGVRDTLGNALTVTGDARSTRIVNSLSVNYSPRSGDGRFLDRTEVALFLGTRYVADRYDGDDIKGLSNLVGADIRFDLGRHVEIGLAGNVRAGMKFDSIAYSGGPQIGFAPFANGWFQLGYNVVGFKDRDFAADRHTRGGAYATLRFKFDQNSLKGLGIGR